MKKLLKFLAVLSMTAFALQGYASAELYVKSSSSEDAVVLSGTTDDDSVTVFLIKPGYTVSDIETLIEEDKAITSRIQAYFQADANNSEILKTISMKDADKGIYTLTANGTELKIAYASLADRYQMIQDLNTARTNGTFSAVYKEDAVYLSDATLYESLSNKDKSALYASQLLAETGTVPQTEEGIQKMAEVLNTAAIIESFNENKITDITTVTDMVSSSFAGIPTEYIEKLTDDAATTLIANLSKKDYGTYTLFYKELDRYLFINTFNSGVGLTNADKKTFFDTYAAAAGISLTKYNALADAKKSQVITQLVQKKTKTISDMQTALDSLCESANPTSVNERATSSSGSSGGGGGGGGVSSSALVSGATAASATEITTTTDVFSDLSDCEWAKEAITYLSNEGIVSGYPDNTFKPLDNITRAEFVTILSKKFLTEYTGDDVKFADVTKDSWSYKYVMSAYACGVVNGMSENEFQPNSYIKREDMAVMLNGLSTYLGKVLDTTKKAFSDASSISDYAEEAVYGLANAGVINGDDKGAFNPKSFATRAEAAQMIYNYLKFIE